MVRTDVAHKGELFEPIGERVVPQSLCSLVAGKTFRCYRDPELAGDRPLLLSPHPLEEQRQICEVEQLDEHPDRHASVVMPELRLERPGAARGPIDPGLGSAHPALMIEAGPEEERVTVSEWIAPDDHLDDHPTQPHFDPLDPIVRERPESTVKFVERDDFGQATAGIELFRPLRGARGVGKPLVDEPVAAEAVIADISEPSIGIVVDRHASADQGVDLFRNRLLCRHVVCPVPPPERDPARTGCTGRAELLR
ncbi:hypothetical protein MT355_00290 [Rathayibacter sp. VKM Ac-2929]|nr:hypothetical protein [Rathayibacter sp. VKM Ac-2929]MCJ1671694.1 hypothetical protein [Rathayibacter sp. VKM Ac-2929]